MSVRAEALATVAITEDARDGRYQIVLGDEGTFALVRWSERPEGGCWVFSSGVPLDFKPTHYHPREEFRG